MPEGLDLIRLFAGHVGKLIRHREDAVHVIIIDMTHHEQADGQLTVAEAPLVLHELVQAGFEDAVIDPARPPIDDGEAGGFRVPEVQQQRVTVGGSQSFERKDHGWVLPFA